MTLRRAAWAAVAVLALCAAAQAQTIVGSRFQLSPGPCTLRSGSGVPSTGLGVVCDTYYRTDSPYTVYVKTGASTWAPLYTPSGLTTGDILYASGATSVGSLPAVATGQVLASAGTGTAPAYTATPTVTSLTATNPETSVWLDNANPGLMLRESDQGTDTKNWQIKANNAGFRMRLINDAVSVANPFFQAERSGMTTTSVTISPDAGDIILAPGGLDILPDVGYTKNLGALTNKWLTLHAAELWVETLVAQNTLATIGGRVLVGPTTTLTSDLVSGATTMNVKHNSLANGDRVLLEANGSVEWIAVASAVSGSGPYTYTITRNLDGSGANNWTAGDAVFNTGTTNSGFIDLYSTAGVISGSGPTIVGNVRTGTTYSNIAARWAIGNLNALYGYGVTTYGAAFGDPSATNVTVDATNGFRIRSGTTNKFLADTSGNLSIVGDLSVGSSGLIRSGATSYASGTGYVLDFNGGTPRLRVGTTAGNRLQWDGTDLTLVSANATIDANGITISPTTSLSASRAYRFTAATGSLGLFGIEGGGAGTGRALNILSEWTGTGNLSNGNTIYIGALHTPASGGTTRRADVTLSATSSSSFIQLNSSQILTDATIGPISTTELALSTGIMFTSDTTVPTGGIAQTAAAGLTLKAVSGSSYDFSIKDAAGNDVIVIAPGSSEIGIAGVSGDGTGKILCVKSDASIGTCTAASINTSTCTCS